MSTVSVTSSSTVAAPSSSAPPPLTFFAKLRETDVVHLLAFIGGFVDTAGYLGCDVFTSSITGNLVVATASVATLRGVICRSSVCVAFFAAGGVASALSLRLRLAHGFSQRTVCVLIFALEIALIIASWIIGMQFDDILKNSADDIDNPLNVLVASLLGISMGFHNVAAKEAILNCPPTTVMTSTMINVAQNLSNTIEYGLAKHALLRLQSKAVTAQTAQATESCHSSLCFTPLTADQHKAMQAKYDDAASKFLTTVKPLFYFIVGGLVGAATMNKGRWHCLAIPVFTICFIIFDILLQRYRISLPQPPQSQYVEIPSPENCGGQDKDENAKGQGKDIKKGAASVLELATVSSSPPLPQQV